MRSHELENWTLSIVSRVLSGQAIEDSRIELKAKWPDDPKRAARQIAGHANSARGEPILWLIGVDEEGRKIPGVNFTDFASWYESVRACFDELAPEPVSLNVPANGVTVAALFFETERAPFVVKCAEGGTVQREVPWREATGVKSVTRSQLLRLLSPLQKPPVIEVLSASLIVLPYPDDKAPKGQSWTLEVSLYAVPKSQARIVIPRHRCKAWFVVKGLVGLTTLDDISFGPWDPGSLTRGTRTEAILDGPGALQINAFTRTPSFALEKAFEADVQTKIRVFPIEAESSISLEVMLMPYRHEVGRPAGVLGMWTL